MALYKSVYYYYYYYYYCYDVVFTKWTTAVYSLPKTVIRQRRGCDLNPGPSAPESNTLTSRLDNFSYEFAHCRFYFYCEKNALRQCKGLLFHSRLKTFLLCKSFPLQCSPSFLLLKYSLCGFPGLFTVVSIFSFFSVFTLFSCRFRAVD